MENTNKKILTVSFVAAGAIAGLTVSILIRVLASAVGFIARVADADIVRHGFPVLVGFGLFLFLQFNPRIATWADEVVVEIKKIVWPSRKDTTAMTIAVCVMVIISSIIISVFDVVSGYALSMLSGMIR